MQTVTTTTAPTLQPFGRQDWAAFGGVETAEPQIAFHEEYAVIQDGNTLSLIDGDQEHRLTLPSPRLAILAGNALLAELVACDGRTDRESALLESFGFSAAIELNFA